MNEIKEYSYLEKKKLADKISKVKNKEDLVKLYSIVAKNNAIMENNNGIFMYFHDLDNKIYQKIENELKIINKKYIYSFDSDKNISEESSEKRKKKMYKPYVNDEFPLQKGICPKLKLNNREKNIWLKNQHDKYMKNDNSDVIYTKFDVSILTNSSKSDEQIK